MPDDLRAISTLLAKQVLCRDCLALKTDLARWQVEDAIERLGGMVNTSEHLSTCSACRKRTVVYTLK